MSIPGVDQIISIISGLPLKDVLSYLGAQKIADYSTEGYHKIKQIIIDKQNEGKYVFVPSKLEAQFLNQFGNDPQYRSVERLVPNYPYIDLIRTGLLIKKYHLINNAESNSRVREIKINILKKPNGQKLLKIADLPTTPHFSTIIKQLLTYSLKGYPENLLQEKFDEMVSDWENSSLLVDKKDNPDIVKSFCEKQIKKDNPQFFILGMRSVAKTVENTIEELIKEEYFKKNKYQHKINKSEEGNQSQVEIVIFRDIDL